MARITRVALRDADSPADPPELSADDSASELSGPSPVVTALAADDTADALDRLQSIKRVRATVFDLPRVHREVIALCDLEELPYATVATILGCPIGTVRSRLSRARALLATRLDLPDESEDDEKRRAVPAPAAEPTPAMDVDASALTLSVRGSAT
jgi:DNA-directed RNA polymerase specialized sigma24 family protein